jgi:teichuronic acid exporter
LTTVQKAKEAFKWTLYLRGLSQLITWVISLVVIRFLTPTDYGIVALTEIIFMFMMLFCSAGLGDALIQRKDADELFVRKMLNILLIVTAVMCTMLFISAPYLAEYYNQPSLTIVLRLSSFIFILTPWLVLASSLLAKKMDFKSRGQIDLFAAVTTSLLSLLLAYKGFGFWALIISSLLNTLLRTFGYTLTIRKIYFPKLDLGDMWLPFKFGITVAATSMMFGLFMKVDVLVIANQIDTQTLGYYALAMHLALLPMVKIMPLVNEVAYPMYASIKENPAECRRIFGYILRIISFTMFPIFFIFSATAPELVKILLGEQWLPAVIALQIILLTIPFRIISNLFSPLLKALGHPQTGLQHVTFSCFTVALLFYYAAPYGLNALAYAWCIATPLILIFALNLSTKRAGILFIDLLKSISKPAFISLITLLLIHLINIAKLDEFNVYILLSLKLFTGLISYIGLSSIFNRNQLNEIIKFKL